MQRSSLAKILAGYLVLWSSTPGFNERLRADAPANPNETFVLVGWYLDQQDRHDIKLVEGILIEHKIVFIESEMSGGGDIAVPSSRAEEARQELAQIIKREKLKDVWVCNDPTTNGR